MRPRLKPLAALVLVALHGCSLAPTYKAPTIDLPAKYREQTSDGPWHSAQPSDQLAPKWWQLYQDPRLNDLQEQLLRPTRTWPQRWRISMRHKRMPANCMPGCSRK